MKKTLSSILLALALAAPVAAHADDGTITQLDPFLSSSTGNITQRTKNQPFQLTGPTPGGCLQLTSQNIATTTGAPCASSGGGVGTSTVPFMANYYVATSTLIASVFPYASTTAVTTTNLCFTGTGGCITSATSTNYWYANGTSIYNANSGNVGIGTTTPNYKLAVVGNGNSSISIGDVSGIANYAGISLNGNGTAGSGTFNFLSSTADSNLYINRPTGAAIQFREQNGTAQMTLQSGGDLGIGTTSPVEKLSILSADNVQTTNIFAVRANNLTQGVALGWNSIREIGTNGNNNFLVDAQGTGSLLLQTVSGGNVGIATSTPGSLLSLGVSGNASGINFGLATSTFENAGGINLTSGCFAINRTCVGGASSGGTVTSVAGGNGIAGTVTTSGSLNLISYLATSSLETAGQIPYWTTTSGNPAKLGSVATTSLGVSGPITFSGTLGAQIGGSGGSFGCTSASNGVTGCMGASDWALLHTATTTFSGPLSYSVSTNAVTCPTCTTGGITSVTGTYPVQSTGGTTPAISLAFGTTTANMWSALQLFNGAASSSSFSVQGGPLWIGGTSTSTIQGNGATSTLKSTLVVASSSPNAFVVQDQYGTQDLNVSTASSTANNSIFQILGTSTPGTLFQVDQYGHLLASSTSPTPAISSCGTGSPVMGANANDVVGTFTTGTSASSCTITFGSPYSATPVVVISDSNTTAVADISSVSTTGFTISLASALSAVNVYYMVVMP